MTRADWLLDVAIDGRTYRWSVSALDVDTADGDTLVYQPGLEDLSLAPTDQVTVSVTDPSVDWPALAPYLDGGAATLRRLVEGNLSEQAETYAAGVVLGVVWGSCREPVSITIGVVSGSGSLGVQLPDPTARVDATTWPIAGATYSLGNAGSYYPIVLGYPGYVEDAGLVYACVPVPIGQWKTGTPASTRVIVCEDASAPITSVTMRNDDRGAEAGEDCTVQADGLGRLVVTANFSADTHVRPSTPTSRMFAGYSPSGGGGPARSAYDVLVYLLRRFGPGTVDWARIPEVRDQLGIYQVDTWIDSPVDDPWAWVESLLADLPVRIRTSERGRYLVWTRAVSDPTRQVGSLSADDHEATRTSAVSRATPPYNELVATYRRSRTGEQQGRVVLTGSPTTLGGAPHYPLPGSSDSQRVVIASHRLCLESVSRWGLRQAEPVEIDWTWDTSTVLAVLERRAEASAVPGLLVDYDVPGNETLREGDEVLLTDTELGWTDQPAIVTEPPVRGATTSVTLLLPGAG